MKPKLLLLDADVIIECHRISAWEALISKTDIYVPSIVVNNEAIYYENGSLIHSIYLPNLVKSNKIHEESATVNEISTVKDKLKKFLYSTAIHAGELEALALVLNRQEEYAFSTGDKAAIHALAYIGFSERGIPLDDILRRTGLSKPVEYHYKKPYFDEHLKFGTQLRIQDGF